MTTIENHPQGDVNRYPISKDSPRAFHPPENAIDVPGDRMILAYGEVTGHVHEVKGDARLVMRESDKDRLISPESAADLERWLIVGEGGATVVHDEHTEQTIEQGVYLIPGRQREYSPLGAQFVGD